MVTMPNLYVHLEGVELVY